MSDAEAVGFTLLGGENDIEDERLVDLYAYPVDTSGYVVRANAIVSLDGGATTEGTSGGLGGPGDRRLFAILRELADVILVGAGTARAENYAGARMTAAQRERRRQRGQAEVPPVALVTRSGGLRQDLRVLVDTEVPPLVLTCAASAGRARQSVGSAAEVLDCSGADADRVDLARALALLADRGVPRVLTEGGPSLLGALIADGLIDEVCLTTAPLVVGGAAMRIVTGSEDVLTRMRRAHILTDTDGYLYSRYVADR